MKRHRIAVIGAGNRGTCLTRAARISSADRFDVVAVVDPDDNALDTYGRAFELNGVDRFPDCGRMFEAGLGLDGAFIANPPHVHADAACALLEAGVPIYLEKPMASDIGGALRIMEAADRSRTRVQVGFNLRYAPFFAKLKELVSSGQVGQVLSVAWKEILDCHHWATYCWHPSFDRSEIIGTWLMEKCCHDLDQLTWIIDSPCSRVASFGSRSFFQPRNDVPDYCTDGCPIESDCNFSALRFYPELKESGCTLPKWRSRCVYNNDSDHVDHQSAVLEYANGVTASFSLMSLGLTNTREVRICGTDATLVGDFDANTVRLQRYHHDEVAVEVVTDDTDGHGGSDPLIIGSFFDYLDDPGCLPKTTQAEGWDAMVTALAIEKARRGRTVVEINAFEDEVRAGGA